MKKHSVQSALGSSNTQTALWTEFFPKTPVLGKNKFKKTLSINRIFVRSLDWVMYFENLTCWLSRLQLSIHIELFLRSALYPDNAIATIGKSKRGNKMILYFYWDAKRINRTVTDFSFRKIRNEIRYPREQNNSNSNKQQYQHYTNLSFVQLVVHCSNTRSSNQVYYETELGRPPSQPHCFEQGGPGVL